jgi:probable F420-dependent oxidoreductase
MSARDRLTGTPESGIANLGVWFHTEAVSAGEAAETAGRIESLGYSTFWLPETVGRDPFAHIAYLATQTESLQFATGIANIFHRHPGVMMQVANTLAEQTDGRFVLGLGVSHGPMVAGLRGLDYSKPLSSMREYLTTMDNSPYGAVKPAEPPLRLLAALGPKMLELSATAADGAHPYFTTPEHTAVAREAIGPDKLLCVEQKVVLSTDAEAARAAANAAIAIYAGLPNYRNNWLRIGFTDDEIEQRADRFVDHVIPWGDEAAIRAGVQRHYDAGADHVCVQPLSTSNPRLPDWDALEALAPRA